MPSFATGSKPPVSTTRYGRSPHAAFAVVAVAREAGQVGDERVARARQPVEKRRFPHIGAPDEGNYGFHQMLFTVERGIEAEPARRNAMARKRRDKAAFVEN